ncbi:hypothetical protein ACFFW8_20570 [Erwinia tracheiphila]
MTTEDELANVVVFSTKKGDLKNEMAMRHEGDLDKPRFCLHDAVWVNQKKTEPCVVVAVKLYSIRSTTFLTLCDRESKYVESVKYLRQEEKQRRQNIERLIQIERNAKSRIRRTGSKAPLPRWQNEVIAK